MPAFRISHFLVRVDRLDQAVSSYRKAGFRVIWGGDPETAHNALIYFERGAFIELVWPFQGERGRAMSETAREKAAEGVPIFQRWHRHDVCHGLCDFALESDIPLSKAIEALQGSVPMSAPTPWSREQANGETTRWELAYPEQDAYLPFVMGPYEPPPKIDPGDRRHPNGLQSIAGIRLAHPKPADHARALASMLNDARFDEQGQTAVVRAPDFTFEIEAAFTPRYESLIVRTTGHAPELPGLVLEKGDTP